MKSMKSGKKVILFPQNGQEHGWNFTVIKISQQVMILKSINLRKNGATYLLTERVFLFVENWTKKTSIFEKLHKIKNFHHYTVFDLADEDISSEESSSKEESEEEEESEEAEEESSEVFTSEEESSSDTDTFCFWNPFFLNHVPI